MPAVMSFTVSAMVQFYLPGLGVRGVRQSLGYFLSSTQNTRSYPINPSLPDDPYHKSLLKTLSFRSSSRTTISADSTPIWPLRIGITIPTASATLPMQHYRNAAPWIMRTPLFDDAGR